MFLDRITLQLHAGNGGDGSIHFAAIKYKPFAGPDGGDGGRGGDVVLVGRRDLDSLEHLRNANTIATNGQPGTGNQCIGSDAPPLEMGVPLGTVVEEHRTLDEIGTICSSLDRLIVARGGHGGKGNPKYATGRRRAPRIAQPGGAGEDIKAWLTYRIYCDTLLLEASGDPEWQLLPQLLAKPDDDVDWELYRRKPRWVRTEHDFARYDSGYLQFDVLPDGTIEAPFIPHLYWARHLCVNLCPVMEDVPALADSILALINDQPLRRIEQITLLLPHTITVPTEIPGGFSVALQIGGTPESNFTAFLGQLTGGVAA